MYLFILAALAAAGTFLIGLSFGHPQGRQPEPVAADAEDISDPELSEKDRLVDLIAQEIVQSADRKDSDWQSVTAVFDVDEGPAGNGGFAYRDETIVPVSASGRAVNEHVRALRDLIRQEGTAPFVQMLVQIRRRDGKFRMQFEYEDRSRWRIGPENLSEMRETLRPQFDD